MKSFTCKLRCEIILRNDVKYIFMLFSKLLILKTIMYVKNCNSKNYRSFKHQCRLLLSCVIRRNHLKI